MKKYRKSITFKIAVMTEKERILNYNQGELPDTALYDIISVRGVSNSEEDLETFKQTIIAFLDNKHLKTESSEWEKILPKKLVQFTNQLEKDDYHKDDLLSHIPAMIDGLKRLRQWEWYSSKLTANGFEVVMKGIFRGIFLPILHHQGLPHISLFITRNGREYPTKAITDVLTYKTFDPITLKLRVKDNFHSQ